METATKEAIALRILADYWTEKVTPVVDARSCVLAGRVASVVLNRIGISTAVYHTDTVAMNELWYELFVVKGLAQALLPPEAWCVGAVTGEVKGTHRNMVGGFSGHLIVTTPNYFVDLSAGQFDRPSHGIVTGSPLIVHRENIVDSEQGKMVPIQQGLYIVRPAEKPASYKWTPDWQTSYKHFTKPLLARLTEILP
jgi:hypothetical protein